MFDNDFYIKCSNTHNKQIEKSVNLKTGELADFHQTKNKVIPVKGKVIIENKF